MKIIPESSKIETEIKEFIVSYMKIEEKKVTLESSLKNDLDFDSLDFVEMIMHLEKEFNITFNDEEVENVFTIKQLINLIEIKLNSNGKILPN